ncbi:acyl-CoA dehydrogenase family protein [Actinotalea sp. Marseille-Q4924]|uniref:acyl-CoA dehydrogenase family protein n=1 Tax=Actinotalea sp. Marseille-Q4924 TaxID=2866571 RepID=UPI001CE47F16|nr:acyl-CoA dehydrogenase family protein [Actinotalea sp. Marseille-Q4924]
MPTHDVLAQLRPTLDRIAAGAADRERTRTLPFEPVVWLRDAGFGALRVPTELGGAGLSLPELVEVVTEVARADSNVAHLWRGHFAVVEHALLGDDPERRRRWASAAVGGVVVGNASSEQGNGGLWDTRTRLTQDEDGRWWLDGIKYYSTGTIFADWVNVGAVLPDGTRAGVLVPVTAPGVRVDDDWDGFGQRLTGSGTTHLDRVPVEARDITPFGSVRPAFLGAYYQLYLLAVLCGIGRAVVDDAVAFVRPRTRTFGRGDAPPPRHDPLVQGVVGRLRAASFAADAATAVAAARLGELLDRGAVATDDDEAAADVAVYQAQVVVCDAVLRATTELFEVGGASSTAVGRGLDRHWRNARTIACHNPVVEKERLLGDHLLNGTPPSATFATRVPDRLPEPASVPALVR